MDSSFIVELADGDDQFHEMARALVSNLKGDKVISDLVLSESVTGVASRLGRKAGSDVFENLFYDANTKVVFLNKRLCERALHLYLKFRWKAFLCCYDIRENNVRQKDQINSLL